MKSMELDSKEGQKETFEAKEAEKPKYPYGLTINLDEQALEKLGLDADDFEVGEEIEIQAMAKVTAVSQYETQGDNHYGCTFQIMEMGIDFEKETSKQAKKVYRKEE